MLGHSYYTDCSSSHGAQASLKLQPRLALNSVSFCLGFPVVRTTDICYRPWLFTFFPPFQVMFPYFPSARTLIYRTPFILSVTSIVSPLTDFFKCVFVSVCLSSVSLSPKARGVGSPCGWGSRQLSTLVLGREFWFCSRSHPQPRSHLCKPSPLFYFELPLSFNFMLS